MMADAPALGNVTLITTAQQYQCPPTNLGQHPLLFRYLIQSEHYSEPSIAKMGPLVPLIILTTASFVVGQSSESTTNTSGGTTISTANSSKLLYFI